MKYFAYGSNMSINRMLQRNIKINGKPERATLHDYEFVINKRSYKNQNIGFANIRKKENSTVEGVLYDVNDLKLLDKHEGFPKHYDKIILPVETKNDTVDAIVYVANEKWITENLKTTEEYKNFILGGKKYLSEEYYNFLNEIIIT
jgi:cation transport regulator ChaC